MLIAKVSRTAALRFVLIALVIIVPVAWVWWVAQAASRTWTGGTPGDSTCAATVNDLWNNPCNWASKALPVAGDDLTFPASTQPTSHNNFTDFTFNSIIITGTNVLQGNSIALNAGITIGASSNISLSSIKLNNNQIFNALTGTGSAISSAIDNNGKTLTLDGAGAVNFSGPISGTGGLTKNGAGTMVLSGANTYTGSTMVNQGALLVTGSQKDSFVSISSGGTLAGTGTVGPINVNSDSSPEVGRISPGTLNNGTGVLNAEGNVFFLGTGVKSFDVDLKGTTAGSGHDQLKGKGTVSLGTNTTLNVTPGFTPSAGSTFLIIDNDGTTDGVIGSFFGHPEGSMFTANGITFFITYRGGDGNDVVLHVPAQKEWTGNGNDNNWTTSANWVGGSAPQLGDILLFPGGSTRLTNTNDFPSGTVFSQIAFTGSGYHLLGNNISITDGMTDLTGSNSVSIIDFTSIKLDGDQTFNKTNSSFMNIFSTIDTNGKTLTINGAAVKTFDRAITGSGGLVINGAGDVQFTGSISTPHTYSGSTVVNSGSFTIFQDVNNSAIQMNGGLIRGNHTVKSITATGGTLQLDNNGAVGLATSADVTLNSAVNVVVALSNTSGSPISRGLTVGGAINLGNATLTPSATFNPAPPAGTSLVVVNKTSAGAIQGTFNNMPEGALLPVGVAVFRISYVGGDGNDVTLTVTLSRTWDGGGTTNNWTEAANWVGDVAPGPGDDLVFPAGAARMSNNNDFPSGTAFSSMFIAKIGGRSGWRS